MASSILHSKRHRVHPDGGMRNIAIVVTRTKRGANVLTVECAPKEGDAFEYCILYPDWIETYLNSGRFYGQN